MLDKHLLSLNFLAKMINNEKALFIFIQIGPSRKLLL